MKTPKSEIIIYQSKSKKGQVEVQIKGETLWLSLQQIADLFDRDKSVISRHLSNIFKVDKLDRKSVVAKNATTAADGKIYQVEYFDLDVILAVGYRVNSKQGAAFRQWSNAVLKEYLTKGYSINRKRLEENAREFEAALELISKAAKSPELSLDAGRGLVDIVTRYAQTFLLLQRYDEGLLSEPSTQKGGKLQSVQEAKASLAGLKKGLISRGEATELFAKEREDGLAALLGNLE